MSETMESYTTGGTRIQRWDCHEHREELQVSSQNSVYHLEQGQLCFWDVRHDCILYYPILFADKAAAWKWIHSGCIAQIQESMSYLRVGFSTVMFKERDR